VWERETVREEKETVRKRERDRERESERERERVKEDKGVHAFTHVYPVFCIIYICT